MTRYKEWHGLDLTNDQKDVLDWLREFCQKEIRPAGPKYHKSQDTPWDIIKKAAQAEIYSLEFFMSLFEDQSGITAALAIEELFNADPGIALAIFGTGLPAAAIIANGTGDQIGKWLPKCFGTKKDPKVAAFCSSETDAGSDVAGMKTTATYDEESDTWTLKGTKDWITNGGIADIHVVVASLDPTLGSRGQASFIVPGDTEGLSQGHKHDKLGFRASHTAEVILDNVVIPGSYLLGDKEKLDKRLEKARKGVSTGGQAAMETFEGTRWMVAAMGVGLARAAYEYARDYAIEREAFGKAIAEHQQIAAMLAELDTDIYHARLGVLDAAQTYLSTGKLSYAQGSKVKYNACELAVRATRTAVQILGGAGYVHDHPVAQWYCDAPLLTIFEGTTQIQKNLITSVATGLRIR